MSPRAGGGAGKRARGGRSLEEYRRKRDFEKTSEPAGEDTAGSQSEKLVFVIQKHAASHLHFDLRLELDGVMRSWAVPRGPSLDPEVKRLAMQVEDHPMEYNRFEGTIPAGEYGGGTVMLWDRGTYRPDEKRPGESDQDAVRRSLKAGKLSFTFAGERLRGAYTLVRTDRGPRPKWLLFRQQGDRPALRGRDITDRVTTSVASGRTMEEITAAGDRVWRSNRGDSEGGEQQGKRRRSAAPVAPAVPMPVDELPPDRGWSFEPWRGGARVLALATARDARLIDGSGRDLTPHHEELAAELASLVRRTGRTFILEGELVEGAVPELHASDLLMEGEKSLLSRSWKARRTALERLFHRRRHTLVALQTIADGSATMLRRARREQWPAVIARRRSGRIPPGEQSDDLVRFALVD